MMVMNTFRLKLTIHTRYRILFASAKALLILNFLHLCAIGNFCPAIAKAVKTMSSGEKAILTIKPLCKCSFLFSLGCFCELAPCVHLTDYECIMKNYFHLLCSAKSYFNR